jgi:outer membrane protein OmpA-like peptidoglycan-associated protein
MKNINRSNDILTWDGTDEKNQYIKKGKLYTLKLLIEQINNIEIEKEYIIQTKPPEFEGIGIQLILAAIDFENKSYDISIEEYGYLNQAAEAINKYAKNYFVNIKGYAVDYEDSEKNLQLSIQRVLAIYNYFITEKKLNPDYIYLTGYGDGNLIEGINKDTILKSGRRVEVELLTK